MFVFLTAGFRLTMLKSICIYSPQSADEHGSGEKSGHLCIDDRVPASAEVN